MTYSHVQEYLLYCQTEHNSCQNEEIISCEIKGYEIITHHRKIYPEILLYFIIMAIHTFLPLLPDEQFETSFEVLAHVMNCS